MNDQVTVRLLLSAGAAVVGFGFLAYCAWARRGRSPAARRWMGNEFGNEPFNERMTVLGGPMFGLICLCFSLGILPVVGRYLMLITFPLGRSEERRVGKGCGARWPWAPWGAG